MEYIFPRIRLLRLTTLIRLTYAILHYGGRKIDSGFVGFFELKSAVFRDEETFILRFEKGQISPQRAFFIIRWLTGNTRVLACFGSEARCFTGYGIIEVKTDSSHLIGFGFSSIAHENRKWLNSCVLRWCDPFLGRISTVCTSLTVKSLAAVPCAQFICSTLISYSCVLNCLVFFPKSGVKVTATQTPLTTKELEDQLTDGHEVTAESTEILESMDDGNAASQSSK
jgi:hypothetical protein